MIGELLPSGIAFSERFDDEIPGDLFPAEQAVIAAAVEKRRREFTTGRWCARQALAGLGIAAVPILPGERGAPGWPPGVVGAITHCDGYRAAVAGRSGDVTSVGVDAEPNLPLPEGVLGHVSLPGERTRMAALAVTEPSVQWERLLFTAKEAVYKTWFPMTRRWLGFEEAEIELRTDGTFEAKLLVDGPVDGFAGRWLTGRGLLVAAIVQP